MIFLGVYYFAILLLFSILENKFGIAHDTKFHHENKTKVIELNDKSNKTLFPIDAADLLECSKYNGYILLDKTNQVTKNETHTNKLLPLENIYLSSHFFGIMESIAGTSGDFVNDAISGLQINRVVQALKETRIQLYLGNFQDSPKIMPKKLSSINLSCIYGNYLPSLNFYHFNNFCEFTQCINNDYLLLSEDHICNYKYSEKYMYGEKMKYFNVLASLNIPIINYLEFDQQFITLFNAHNIYNDQMIHLNRYLFLSNELGLSLFINFGIRFFGKLESDKYYLLIKIVPPNTFWIKDEYKNLEENSRENKVINPESCTKYENGTRFFEKNTVSIIETDKKSNNLIVNRNSVTYLNISFNKIIKCLGKYSINIYTRSSDGKSLIIKIFDKEKNEFRDLEMIENLEKNKGFNYLHKFSSNYKLFSIINMMIINENNSNISINYIISCKDNRVSMSNLLSSNLYVLKEKVLWIGNLEISFNSTKLANYSNGIIFTILILSLLISAPILGLLAVAIKSIIKRFDSREISHLRIPLTENVNTKFKNTLEVGRQSKYNEGEKYPIRTLEIPFRLKKDFISPLSSPVSSQADISRSLYNQLQSPDQIELFTAISNNISSESIQYNTDTCSSPSTIKSITFKH
ncbi:putative transmembrane domain-containing [Cryptosporidium hominis]